MEEVSSEPLSSFDDLLMILIDKFMYLLFLSVTGGCLISALQL